MTFRLRVESSGILPAPDSVVGLLNKLNATSWMGKEPGSCRLIDVEQVESVTADKSGRIHPELILTVGHRPHGWISDVKPDGRQRLNGWTLEKLDVTADGTLLDGKGGKLPDGASPVYLPFEMCHRAEYNDFEFGDFIGEQDGDPK